MDRSFLTYSGQRGITFGVVVHAPPHSPSFKQAMRVAQEALEQSCEVFLYLLDDAVGGGGDSSIHELIQKGAKISACGYALEKRSLDCPEEICPAGLTTLSDILLNSDSIAVYN